MEELVTEFLINGIGFALLLSVVLCGAIRFGLGPENGAKLAGAAIALAFLATYANLLDWPPFPPLSATQKIAYLVLFGLIIGLALDLLKKRRLLRPALVLFPAVIIGWIGWRQLTSSNIEGVSIMAGLWLAGAFVFLRLQAVSENPNPHAAVLVLAASVGAAIVSFLGAAASQAQLMGILAASVGGFLLWNWPTPRLAFSGAAIFGSGTALLAVATTIILYSDVSKLALLLIIPVFLAPAVLANNQIVNRPALRSLAIGGVTLIPVAIATAIALFFLDGSQ